MPAYILSDSAGNNYVDSVTRKIDENQEVYYEARGRNSQNGLRTVRIYENSTYKYYVDIGGVETVATNQGVVHSQIIKNLSNVLKHFNISLDFKKPIAPQEPQGFPTRDFFIKAAKRAVDLGDLVITKQAGAHFTRQQLIGTGSTYYNEGNTTRLNLFHDLVSDQKEGYFPFAATTAYGLSLLTYIAVNYDILQQKERERLYLLYQCVAGEIPGLELAPTSEKYRLALAKGLKAEVNEITAFREAISSHRPVDTELAAYNHDLIHGNAAGRSIVDKQTSHFVTGDATALKRTMPGFFPLPPQTGTADQIVLQAGGCKTHSAIVCIWKQGVDSTGTPVLPGDGKTIERYKVYRTVCNAGFGTTYDVRTDPPALYHEIYSPKADGQTYSVCTQELLLPDGITYSHGAMQQQIEALVDAERKLLIFHDLPGKKGPNGEIGTLDTVKQQEWRNLNERVRLGPVEIKHSVLSQPQVTGNCTVRSIQEYLRWELIRSGVSAQDAEKTLNGHWEFARKNNSDSIKKRLDAPKPAVVAMNLEKPQRFFTHPSIPPFPIYLPDTADHASTSSLVAEIRSGAKACPKPTMMLAKELIDQIKLEPQTQAQSKIGLYLLQGCDARQVPSFECMQGSVRQVASQFNNGESQDRSETGPNLFYVDSTQGPAEQRTSGGAAIARYAHNKDCDCLGVLLSDPVIKQEFDTLFDYKFGYLTPRVGQEQKGLEFLKKHIDKLVLNVERVAIDGTTGQTAIQVLNSGLALGQYDFPGREPENLVFLKQISEVLLTVQYKAVAAVAILEAKNNPGKRIPLSLTLLGGGFYGNDKHVIAASVSHAIKYIKESGVDNIDICLSIFKPEELLEWSSLTAKGEEFAELRTLLAQTPITQDQLRKMKSLAEKKPEHLTAAHEKTSTKSKEEQIKANPNIIEAMQRSIEALSSKPHLLDTERETKKNTLEGFLEKYTKASSTEESNTAILNFVLAAAKQRESKWSSFFTSRFGETASLKAFYKQMDTDQLKEALSKATSIDTKNFQSFAKGLQAKHEKGEGQEETSKLLKKS